MILLTTDIMIKSGRIVTELYSIIVSGNYTFLKIRRAIWPFKYQVGIFFLDEFEKKFRTLYNLPPFSNQVQDQRIHFVDPKGNDSSVYVTAEFYQRLSNEYKYGEFILAKGYIVFIRKNKIWDAEKTPSTFDQELVLEMESMKSFAKRLEKSLMLTKHGNIVIGDVFAYVPNENKIIRSELLAQTNAFMNDKFIFEERDNYALKIFLNLDNKISYSVDLAIQSFIESFHIQNAKLRYLNMLLSLELCFNKSSEESFEIICRYASSLLAKNDNEFQILLEETTNFYNLKNKIIEGNIMRDLITESEINIIRRTMTRLEDVLRQVIKKLVRFNHKEREKFIEELESRMQ